MTAHTRKQDEYILVVPRIHMFPDGIWHGINQKNIATYLRIIQEHQTFIPRSIAEHDPSYKQIIPYIVFMHDDAIFVMQRQAHASEARLRNKHPIGIGGHIRQEDMLHGNTIFDWARREFDEEVAYTGSGTIVPIGMLNDDSNDVGKVHLGLVLVLHGDSAEISIRSELKNGQLVPLEQCARYKDTMESWSIMVLAELLNRRAVPIHHNRTAVEYQ